MRKRVLLSAALCGVMGLTLAACVPDLETGDTYSASEEAVSTSASWAASKSVEEGLKAIQEYSNAHAPKVITLSDGTQVQRTPSGNYSYSHYRGIQYNYNTMYANADERGCDSCHTDGLADLISNKLLFDHFDVTNGLGMDLTPMDCRQCHDWDGYTVPADSLGSLIHGIHSTDSFTGNCMSCHEATADGKGMVLYEEAKYDILDGITFLDSVDGEFRFDQDTVSRVPQVNWFRGLPGEVNIDSYDHQKKGDALDPGVLENWEIAITGLVDNPVSVRLKDLIDDPNTPIEKRITGGQCVINPAGGGLVTNVEITGIPLSYVFEHYGVSPKASATSIYCTDGDNYKKPATLESVNADKVFLVYKINGEPLNWSDGYPCAIWDITRGSIGNNVRWVSEIRVADDPVEELELYTSGFPNKEGVLPSKPNAAIMNFHEGQIIEAGKPYEFEGYAHAFDQKITAVELSLDRGKTWKTFDTSSSDPEKWVHWNFTYVPEEEGAFVLTVRAKCEDGSMSSYPDEVMFNVMQSA